MTAISNLKLIKILNLLTILLLPAFILGPFLLEAINLIFLVFFCIFYFNKDESFYYVLKNNKIYIFYFFIFWFLLIISSIFSEKYGFSYKNSIFYFRFLIFSLIILYCLQNFEKLKKLTLSLYLIILMIILLTSIYEVLFDQNFFDNAIFFNGRITSVFLDEKVMGSYIIKSAPIIFALLYLSKIKYKFTVCLLIYLISFFLVVLSGERTALAHFFILSVLLIKLPDFRKIIFFILVFIISLLLIFPKNISDNPSFGRLVFHTMSQIGMPLLGKGERIRIFSPVHEYHFISAFKMFLDNPLLGVGPNNFRHECKKDKYFVNKIPFVGEKVFAKDQGYYYGNSSNYSYFSRNNIIYEREVNEITPNFKNFKFLRNANNKIRIPFDKGDHIYTFNKNLKINGCNTHPHNLLAQFFAETGILGSIFYISGIIFCLYKIINIRIEKNNKSNPIYLMSVSILIFLFPILPSGNFFNNYLSFGLFWNIAFYLYSNYLYSKKVY